MGHHKGDWSAGDVNISVRFKARVSAEYTLIESIKLSAADFSVLEAESVPVKPVPKQFAANSLGALGTAAYGGRLGLEADINSLPPAAPNLAVLQPELYNKCFNNLSPAQPQNKVDADSCVQLAIWTYNANGLAGYGQALDLFSKACDGKFATACTHLGDLLVSNGSTASGISKLQLGCQLNDGLACYMLGEMIERRLVTAMDVTAKSYFERACKQISRARVF